VTSSVLPALSLYQPWASLIASGHKIVETRTWRPHADLIGHRMAFASTGTMPKEAKDALRHGTPGFQALLDAAREAGFEVAWDKRKLIHNLPLGKVLCTARIAGAYPMIDAAAAAGEVPERCLLVAPRRLLIVRPEGDLDVSHQRPYGLFEPGRVAWLLDSVRPVVGDHPAHGRQGVWNWRPSGIFESLQ